MLQIPLEYQKIIKIFSRHFCTNFNALLLVLGFIICKTIFSELKRAYYLWWKSKSSSQISPKKFFSSMTVYKLRWIISTNIESMIKEKHLCKIHWPKLLCLFGQSIQHYGSIHKPRENSSVEEGGFAIVDCSIHFCVWKFVPPSLK